MTRKRIFLVTASLVVPILLVLTLFVTAGGLLARPSTDDSSVTATYLGSNRCKGCHGPGNAFDLPDMYTPWHTTAHGQMVNTAQFGSGGTVVGSLADLQAKYGVTWSQEIAMMASGNAKVLGIGINVQEFTVMSGTEPLVLPIEWVRFPDEEQTAEQVGEWEAPATHTDPSTWTKWLNSCAPCHTTGFNYAARTYSEVDIACEACHGPGSEHPAASGNAPGQRKIYAKPDAQVCGQCHMRASSASPVSFPIGYVPGLTLTDFYTPVTFNGTANDARRWWQTPDQKHAKTAHTQWIEWGQTAHANSLSGLRSDSCLQCHSAEYRLRDTLGYTPTLQTVQFSITCEACHDPHTPGPRGTGKGQLREVENAFVTGLCTRCHDSGDPALNPGSSLQAEEQLLCADCHTSGSNINPIQRPGEVHHPMVEAFTGVTTATFGLDKPIPSAMHMAGVTCKNCHMPGTGTEGERPVSTHSWQPITPGLSITGTVKGIPNACTNGECHQGEEGKGFAWNANPDTNNRMAQALIDNRQAEIRKWSEGLKGLLDANIAVSNTAAYKQAWTAVSFVESEGSEGIHNFAYSREILKKGLNAMGVGTGKPGYVGQDTCKDCHSTYNAWTTTLHSKTFLAATPANIKADFSLTNTINISDVLYVVGTKYRQQFVVQQGNDLVVAPLQWNIEKGIWQSAPAASWTQDCMGCHTVGADKATKSWVAQNVGCEDCHGPGEEHANSADPSKITVTIDPQVCGACHNSGTDPHGNAWPVDYRPGMTLTFNTVPFTNLAAWWPTGLGDGSVQPFHAHQNQLEYPEYAQGGHSAALATLRANSHAQDSCLECHSQDYRDAEEGEKPTLATAEYPIVCRTCHSMHSGSRANQLAGADQTWIGPFCKQCHQTLPTSQASPVVAGVQLCGQCHNAEDFQLTLPGASGVHHPMLEVFTGAVTQELGIDQAMPSPMHMGGVTCANCHMPPTANTPDGEHVSTHAVKIITPGLSISGPTAGIPNACSNSGCHSGAEGKGFARTDAQLQQVIDTRQTAIKSGLATLLVRLNAVPAPIRNNPLYKQAATAYGVVNSEGSFGIHNYQYSTELLSVANEKLDQLPTVVTYTVYLPVVRRR